LRQAAAVSLQDLKLGEEQKKLSLQVSSFKSTLIGISISWRDERVRNGLQATDLSSQFEQWLAVAVI
jgi:hypothetical protein